MFECLSQNWVFQGAGRKKLGFFFTLSDLINNSPERREGKQNRPSPNTNIEWGERNETWKQSFQTWEKQLDPKSSIYEKNWKLFSSLSYCLSDYSKSFMFPLSKSVVFWLSLWSTWKNLSALSFQGLVGYSIPEIYSRIDKSISVFYFYPLNLIRVVWPSPPPPPPWRDQTLYLKQVNHTKNFIMQKWVIFVLRQSA